MSAYLVLLRMEVAAFHPLPVKESDSSLWPCSSPWSAARAATYSVRALPGILLCGARTFLSPWRLRGRGSGGLAGFEILG